MTITDLSPGGDNHHEKRHYVSLYKRSRLIQECQFQVMKDHRTYNVEILT